MNKINTEILINAPIAKIWNTLLDFDSYSEWNPFIQKIEGTPSVGTKLKVTIKPHDGKPMVFKPVVQRLSDYELCWKGNLFVNGLFDGKHKFELIQETENTVKFIHSEIFTGLLSKPMFALIGKSSQIGFEQMNKALKELCEAR